MLGSASAPRPWGNQLVGGAWAPGSRGVGDAGSRQRRAREPRSPMNVRPRLRGGRASRYSHSAAEVLTETGPNVTIGRVVHGLDAGGRLRVPSQAQGHARCACTHTHGGRRGLLVGTIGFAGEKGPPCPTTPCPGSRSGPGEKFASGSSDTMSCWDRSHLHRVTVLPSWSLAGDTDCFIVVANWPATRREHWRTLVRAWAIENQAYVVAVNRCRVGRRARLRGRQRDHRAVRRRACRRRRP